MKKFVPLIIFFVFSVSVFAQTDAATVNPAGARSEIVRSPVDQVWIFRLDKFTGEVSQLVFSNDQFTWAAMSIERLPAPVTAKPIYQIFMARDDIKKTFLLNTETGQTWALRWVTNKNTSTQKLMWMKFGE